MDSLIPLLIFGGTTEGRVLAEWAAGNGIETLVCVATGYGARALAPCGHLHIHEGRLDEAEMRRLFDRVRPRIVVDATHPYATKVTRTVQHVCGELGLAYLRVLRDSGADPRPDTYVVEDAQGAADLLRQDDRAVLITTGSKDLAVFARDPVLRGRVYARVLPDSRVLAACEALGLRGKHLIAMQGPFTAELNAALLRQVGAGWLVTKESGANGGFGEKLSAAKSCGVRVIVICRPGGEQEEGVSLAGAKRILQKSLQVHRSLSLVGMGMGGGGQLTVESLQALERCEIVFGAPRMIEDIQERMAGKRTEALYHGADILAYLGNHPEYSHAGVVYSGDIGFHSGCADLLHELGGREGGWEVRAYPGISTVSCLCARFKAQWDNLYLASAHGQECDIVSLVRLYPRVFLLLGGSATISAVCGRLVEDGFGHVNVKAGVRLGYPDERLYEGRAEELMELSASGLAAMILERGKLDNER